MTLSQVAEYFKVIQEISDVVDLTIAEFLSWNMIKMQQILNSIDFNC